MFDCYTLLYNLEINSINPAILWLKLVDKKIHFKFFVFALLLNFLYCFWSLIAFIYDTNFVDGVLEMAPYLYMTVFVCGYFLQSYFILKEFKHINLSYIKVHELYFVKQDPKATENIGRLCYKKAYYFCFSITTIYLIAIIGYLYQGLIRTLFNFINGQFEVEQGFPRAFRLSLPAEIFISILENYILIYAIILSIGILNWSISYAYCVEFQVSVMDIWSRSGLNFNMFIKEHQDLLRSVRHFFKVYRRLTELRLGINTVGFTLVLFFLALETGEGINYLSLLIDTFGFVAEIIVYCFIGHKITSELDRISFYLYQSNWHDYDKNNKFQILNGLTGSQISIIPKVFFKTVSIQLPTVVNILQMCYSYFTLLKYFNSKK